MDDNDTDGSMDRLGECGIRERGRGGGDHSVAQLKVAVYGLCAALVAFNMAHSHKQFKHSSDIQVSVPICGRKLENYVYLMLYGY